MKKEKVLFGLGEKNDGLSKYFIGQSYLNTLASKDISIWNVTFEPGCRNNWHIHHVGGQVLLVTDGEGWYQEEGKAPIKLVPGVVIEIGAEVKHWHGASKDSVLCHIAIEIPAEGSSNEWCEPVEDEYYESL